MGETSNVYTEKCIQQYSLKTRREGSFGRDIMDETIISFIDIERKSV
jgi:hypothetical protein